MTGKLTGNRRGFLRKAGTLAAGAAMAGPYQGLLASGNGWEKRRPDNTCGYGELVDAMDCTTGQMLLRLPKGFEYRTFGAAGSLMDDGQITPPFHDGMMLFRHRSGRGRHKRPTWRLVRNHETRFQLGNGGGLAGSPQPASGEVGTNPYDEVCNGGTTTIEVCPDGDDWGDVRSWRSSSGTYFNCSGGNTSYRTWITCEELNGGPDLGGGPFGGDFFGNGTNLTQKHGYIYEVDSRWGPGENPVPEPITHAGRFTHEGAVMDPQTGYLYMTQDDFFGPSGLYRYIPPKGNNPRKDRKLHDGGTLQMLRVVGLPQAELYNTQAPGSVYDVDWVTIPDPDPTFSSDNWLASLGAVAAQGIDQGAAQFSRLEGIRRRGQRIFFTSTQGGQGREGASSTFGPGFGQVWKLNLRKMRLRLVYEVPPPATGDVGPDGNLPALNLPDNIAISPRGTLAICEDGTIDDPPFVINSNFLKGLTRDGKLFEFAENIVDDGEFAGVTFSPDLTRMFFNVQTTGLTYEVRGPFHKGPF